MSITSATIIRRSLTGRLFSTLTTIVTVAVAVGLMLVLLSMGESSRKAFERGAGNMHLLVSNDTNRLVSVLNAVFYAGAFGRSFGCQWGRVGGRRLLLTRTGVATESPPPLFGVSADALLPHAATASSASSAAASAAGASTRGSS